MSCSDWRKKRTRLSVVFGGAALCMLLAGCVSDVPSIALSPTLSPNVFCEAGRHKIPVFKAEQLLFIHSEKEGDSAVSGANAYRTPEQENPLVFPDGGKVYDPTGDFLDVLQRQLWRTGRYRIIVHDRRTELPDSPVQSHPWGDCLRRYAMLNGIPLLILHGEDSDAPLLPGVPRNVRQYWQCPECAKLYYEEHRAKAEKQSRVLNVLLFPINVVPDMVAGMCIFTGAAIYAIFTSDEFGWFAVALPSMPFAGAIFGIGCAWYGLPFWNVRLPEM